jgi:hypothetical protein
MDGAGDRLRDSLGVFFVLLGFAHFGNPETWLRAFFGFALTFLTLGATTATFVAAGLDIKPLIDVAEAVGIQVPR